MAEERPRLAIVVAVAENGVIGDDNRLIWRLKSDMKHFRALTMGRPMIMGRKTFESIGKPLPGRETIVMTRDPAFAAPGVRVARDFASALAEGARCAAAMGSDRVIIAGGAEIYRLALPVADEIHVTEVVASPAGDAHFPAVDPAAFRETAREHHPAGPDDDHAFSFVTYLRR